MNGINSYKRDIKFGLNSIPILEGPAEVMQFTKAANPPPNDDFFIMRLEDALPSNIKRTIPHKRACFDITLLRDCRYKRSVNQHSKTFSGDYITFVSPYQTHSYQLPKIQPSGFSLFFSHTFASLGYNNTSFACDFPFFSFDSDVVLPLTQNKRNIIISILEKIHTDYQNSGENSHEFIQAYFHVLLLEIRKLYFEQVKAQNTSETSSHLVSQFISLLEKNCTQKMSVDSYADMLNVTPRHLSDLLKKDTGKTAIRHIQDRLMTEAKSILSQTNWSVSEISYQLAFKDPSHFGKLFKRHHGITPQVYRVQQKNLRRNIP